MNRVVQGEELLSDHARRALVRCGAGDFRGVDELLAALDRSEEAPSRAWSLALRAAVWLAFPTHTARPIPMEVHDLSTRDERALEPALRGFELLELAHVVAWDAEALEATLALHRELGRTRSLEARDAIAIGVGELWTALFRGEAPTAAADDAFERASATKDPSLVVQTTALRAFATCASGDIAKATELARRASIMARNEGLPQEEYLAHLVLARVRRFGRQPHRALRILEALTRVASPPWQAWIRWEEVFAAGAPARLDALPAETTSALGTVRLSQSLASAGAGDRPSFDATSAELLEGLSRTAFAREEARQLILALTPHPAGHRGAEFPSLAAWQLGTSPLLPPPLHGFHLSAGQEPGSATAYVMVRPNAAQRFLSHGKPMSSETDVESLPQSRRVEGRVETLVAILALAGDDGLTELECFAHAYGFAYVAERHRSAFDVLIHRARGYVEGRATIERSEGQLRLLRSSTFIVPDPRCSERVTDRLLRVLGARGEASARSIATELGISLRSAQEALHELANDGACDSRKSGRSVTYVVEDTAFSEPTRQLHASQLGEPLESR